VIEKSLPSNLVKRNESKRTTLEQQTAMLQRKNRRGRYVCNSLIKINVQSCLDGEL
jgi:hypothetical protein